MLGLPLGGVAAFVYPANGLLGIWWGMTLAVSLHLTAYSLICFCPRVPGGIRWHRAAAAARVRLKLDATTSARLEGLDPPPGRSPGENGEEGQASDESAGGRSGDRTRSGEIGRDRGRAGENGRRRGAPGAG